MFWCLESISFVFTEKFQNLDFSQKYQDFLKVILNFLKLCTVGMLQKQSLGSPGGLGDLVSSGILDLRGPFPDPGPGPRGPFKF